MAVNTLLDHAALGEDQSQQQEQSPYLPPERGRLAEYLVRLRHRFVYYPWKRTIRRYERTRPRGNSPISIFDVGCGPGNFLCCLEHWFPKADINGLDLDADLLAYAARRVRRRELLQGNAQQLPVADQSLDIVSALQVAEHLDNPDCLIADAYRVLKPSGLFLLATPNPCGLAARTRGDKWQGHRSDHISLRRPDRWRQALMASGFEIVSDGTTLLNGLPVIGRFPLGLPLQVLQALFGWFPWSLGESYMAVAHKRA